MLSRYLDEIRKSLSAVTKRENNIEKPSLLSHTSNNQELISPWRFESRYFTVIYNDDNTTLEFRLDGTKINGENNI